MGAKDSSQPVRTSLLLCPAAQQRRDPGGDLAEPSLDLAVVRQQPVRHGRDRDRSEQRPERFTKGDKVDARVTNIDSKTRKVGLSIKAREIAEEKEAVEQYGSSDSGASLGDILGAALKKRETN